jgi:5'-3' exonuclease|tara:strand:- start:571 stop:1533 length:963 start_codon:yes stop_codon:yes gene_type:complete
MKRVMLVDCMNIYLRSYIVDPSLSANGAPIGGFKGFLKTLQKLCREIRPDKVIVVWDCGGGSRKRKTLNKNYKAGRSPVRLNREVRNLTLREEQDNKVWQQIRLSEYLNQLPIMQYCIEDVEADDIISYLVQNKRLADYNKIIISSDKDFYQLCDDKTIIYRPTQKEVLNKNSIVDQFGIHPNNFALARAIAGDPSDNLKGVPGAGLKTISKRFSFMCEEKDYLIEDIVRHCEGVEKPLLVHKRIIENVDKIKQNYRLMQLYSPSLSPIVKSQVNYILENTEAELNLTEFRKMMMSDGFGEWDNTDLIIAMRKIVASLGK